MQFFILLISIVSFETSWAFGALCSAHQNGISDQFSRINEAVQRGARGDVTLAGYSRLIHDPFYNENGCFNEYRDDADSCTAASWLKLSMVERAEYVRLTYEELLAVHGLDYSPRILVCKVVRESCLRPQDESPVVNSSASGLTQVTRSTARDLFERGSWFTPQVERFENIQDGATYHKEMRKSVAAQLELGLAVLHQKSFDHNSSNIKTLLKNYYGLDTKSNQEYADRIYECADCIKTNGDQISESCLSRARASCFDGRP